MGYTRCRARLQHGLRLRASTSPRESIRRAALPRGAAPSALPARIRDGSPAPHPRPASPTPAVARLQQSAEIGVRTEPARTRMVKGREIEGRSPPSLMESGALPDRHKHGDHLMRVSYAALALASTALATTAYAQDTGPYVGLEGGVVWADELDDSVDIFDDDGDEDVITLDSDMGWEIGAVAGYDFGRFRLEGEGSYKRIGVDRITSDVIDLDPVTPGIQTERGLDGDLTVTSLMANALVDFGPSDGVNFFVGGGAGYSWVSIDSEFDFEGDGPGGERLFADDDDSGFSWQLLA